jgi:NhaP-type Na+/H+ or K+/H+ antiporter
VESGINDGIALPLVIIFLGEVGGNSADLWMVAWELVAGLGVGVLIPWLAIRLESSRFFGSAGVFRPLNAFAVGLLVLAVSLALNVNIFLAAFAAGISVARLGPEVSEAFSGFGEIVTELLKLAAILIFGLELAPGLTQPLSLAEIAFIVLALFVVRMVAIEISFIGSGTPRSETLAAAWFGPKGFGSVVYNLMILEMGMDAAGAMAHLVGITIMLSILMYSSTDILVARWFRRRAAAA